VWSGGLKKFGVNATGQNVLLGNANGGSVAFANANHNITVSSNMFQFNTTQGLGYSFMGGNLGIGTSSPSRTLTVTGDILTATLTATGTLTLPNGSAPTVDAIGELAVDTTDNQLLLGTTTNALAVIRTKAEIFKFSVPSTSPSFAAGTTKYLPRISDGYLIDEVWCGVEGGTNKIINILGTNITCTTGAGASATPSITSITAGSSTVAYTASTTSGVVNWLNVTITGRWIRE
jgi:hypothetical protein